MNYCFVECWHPDMKFPSESVFVALSESAVYHFDKHNIPYIMMEDFYDSGELKGDTESYLREQLVWINQFDEYIQKVYPKAKERNLRLATIFSETIKARVDNVILVTKILIRFIDQKQPTKIWYYDQKHGVDIVSHSFKFYGETVYSRLIQTVCTAKKIPLERVYIHPENVQQSILAKVKPLLRKSKFIQNLKNKKQLTQLKKSIKNTIEKKSTNNRRVGKVFFLNYTDFILDFCQDLYDYGFEVLLRHQRQIYQYSNFTDLTYQNTAVFNEVDQRALPQIDPTTFETFFQGPLTQWIDDRCEGVPVHHVLRKIFERFLMEYCPNTIVKIEQFIYFFDKHEIDYVVNHSPTLLPHTGSKKNWCIDFFAAMAAAEYSKKTISVAVSHGVDGFESKTRFCTQTSLNDIFIFATQAEAEHEEHLKRVFHSSMPRAYHMSYFREARQKKILKAKMSEQSLERAQGKSVVVFVPIMMVPLPQRKFEKTQSFPMEYIQWHKALLHYMSGRQDYYFIWKGLFIPMQNRPFDMIQRTIEDKGYVNIQFESGKLIPWLKYADRMICDMPSTAFFEGLFAGISTMSLYRSKESILRYNIHNTLGKNICPYISKEEGVEQVQKFLDADKSLYQYVNKDDVISLPDILNKHLQLNDVRSNRSDTWRALMKT